MENPYEEISPLKLLGSFGDFSKTSLSHCYSKHIERVFGPDIISFQDSCLSLVEKC